MEKVESPLHEGDSPLHASRVKEVGAREATTSTSSRPDIPYVSLEVCDLKYDPGMPVFTAVQHKVSELLSSSKNISSFWHLQNVNNVAFMP